MNRNRKLVSAVLSYLVFLGEAVVLCLHYLKNGTNTFVMFTNDSNILFALSALVFALFQTISIIKGTKVPKAALIFKLAGTVGVTLTLITVYCCLCPITGRWSMAYEPSYSLWVHTVFPLIGIISFLFIDIDKGERVSFFDSLYGVIPMVLYAAIIIPLVAVNTIEPPYFFMDINNQQWWVSLLWVLGMVIGTEIISFLLVLGTNVLNKEKKTAEALPCTDNDEKEVKEESVDDVKEEKNDDSEKGDDNMKKKEDIKIEEVDEGSEEEEEKNEIKAEKEAKAKGYGDGPRVYHIGRQPSGVWQVKLATGQKAIKLFDTQAQAIDYAKSLVKTQGGSIRIHSRKGHMRKE
ncbi:MAG: DUF2188 domain-containing protein [Bacilli bacterium]